MTSSVTGSSSGVNGVALTLVNSSLTVSQNNALGLQNVSAGTTGVKIGSYAFSASSAEGANINTVSVQLTPGSTTAAFYNLKVYANGTQFGTTQPVVAGNATYSFSGSAFNVPAGATVNVDVYADTLSAAAGTYSPATSLTGFSGVGQVSYTSLSLASTVPGQAVSFNGQPALTIAQDGSNPAAGQIVQNSTGNTLAVYRFTETSNVENVKVTQLSVVGLVATSTIQAGFNTLSLYNGSTLLGTANSPVYNAGQGGYVYTFPSFATALVVPSGNSVSLTLKGNAGSITAGSITDNSTTTFAIVTSSTITAFGNTSNKTAVVTLSNATGNPQTLLRTALTVAGASVGGTPPTAFSQIGSVTFTANTAGDVTLNSIKLTLNSTATSSFMTSLVLRDSGNNDIVAVKGYATTTISGTTKTWTFATSTVPSITAGNSVTYTLWGDLTTIPAISNQSQSLTATIAANTDLSYYDGDIGSSPAPMLVTLPTNQSQIQISNITTPVGGQF